MPRVTRYDSEHIIQCKLIEYLRINCKPDVFYFSVPNGGLRNVRVAQKLKREGLMPGVADLCFMLPGGRAAWLELKTEIGRLSDHQVAFKARCARLGHAWGMARSVAEAIPHLVAWDVLKASATAPPWASDWGGRNEQPKGKQDV